MPTQLKTLVLIDGNAIIHRSYHGLPPLTTKKGELVNAVYGFTMTLLGVLDKFRPEYIAASFDLAGPTFRHEKFADYKGKRVKAPDDLYAQIPRVKEIVRAFNIPIFEKDGYEADDIIGTLARQAEKIPLATARSGLCPRSAKALPGEQGSGGQGRAEKAGVNVIIVTGDMDTLQLVSPRIKIFTMRKGLKDTVLYDEAGVWERMGLSPDQIADFKGLRGDASDNIPGVKGIGEKTACELLKAYGTLEGVYENLEKVKPKVREKLEAEKKIAFLSRELGEIDTQVPIALNLQAAESHDYDRDKVVQLFRELEFFSLLKRLPGADEPSFSASRRITEGQEKKSKVVTRQISEKKEVESFLKGLQGKKVALWLKEETGSLFGNRLEALELATEARENVSVLWDDKTKPALKIFLEDGSIPKITYDGKKMMKRLGREDIRLAGLSFDVLIAAYILNSGSNVELEYLCLAELGEERVEEPAAVIYRLATYYTKRLLEVSATQPKDRTLANVYRNIEMPLIPVLAEMEKNGIGLNAEKFAKMAKEFGAELERLEKDIFKFAGSEFNIGSPKQLQKVLFEDLHIPIQNLKKTKTGISTASSELGKLREYPIIEKIESYRELAKLKNTYLDVLPTLLDQDGRLHTIFNQAVAATGRLSSSDPNLQNIPARREWSERIRGAFEARPGYSFVGVDYSQIELRVMAHLSQDKALLSAFRKGEDVHRTTAAVVYKVKPEEVSGDMRRQAKVFNFGIMYGMGAYGLAEASGIEQKDAAKFILDYFKKFSGVAKFIQEMKDFARTNGFIETELGRRRYVPEIQSDNQQVARSGERMAVNMPIQGLAADIMKLAMLASDRIVKKYDGAAHMVLQVHDELIFEVEEKTAPKFATEIKECMENIYPLSVPLTVEVSIGKNWGEI